MVVNNPVLRPYFLEYAYLVGGFNPFEKYARQIGFIFPNFRGEHEKIFELPLPSYNLPMIF